MRVAVDVMGGDKGLPVNIRGVQQALESYADITQLVLVGDVQQVEAELKTQGLSPGNPRLRLAHASQVVHMDEPSTTPLRAKKDSSITVASQLMKAGEVDAVVSAGHTGASVAATVVKNRMLQGIDRPGISAVFPAPQGPFVLVDAGANVDSKPIHLAQYAVLGEAHAHFVLGIKNPRVGLLSVGAEDGKGNELTRETFRMLSRMPVNFIGNVEGHDFFSNKVDVVVCDGFVGNAVLKTCESLAKAITSILKQNLKKNPVRMAGALLSKNALQELKELVDDEEYGGAPLLGINGVCIISHGSASPKAIKNAIRVATIMVKAGINERISTKISTIDWAAIQHPQRNESND